jgi:hypothetical protein
VSVMVLGGAAWDVIHFDAFPFRAAMGFASHTLCSGAFVSRLNPDQVYADTLKPMPGIEKINGAIGYEVDTARREVAKP